MQLPPLAVVSGVTAAVLAHGDVTGLDVVITLAAVATFTATIVALRRERRAGLKAPERQDWPLTAAFVAFPVACAAVGQPWGAPVLVLVALVWVAVGVRELRRHRAS